MATDDVVSGGKYAESTSESPTASDRRSAHADRARQSYEDLAQILEDFFKGSAYVLRPGGECHLRLTDNYATSRGLKFASRYGFNFDVRRDFFEAYETVYRPLGYRPAAVEGDRGQKRGRPMFNVRHSSTYVFRRGHVEAPLLQLPVVTRDAYTQPLAATTLAARAKSGRHMKKGGAPSAGPVVGVNI